MVPQRPKAQLLVFEQVQWPAWDVGIPRYNDTPKPLARIEQTAQDAYRVHIHDLTLRNHPLGARIAATTYRSRATIHVELKELIYGLDWRSIRPPREP